MNNERPDWELVDKDGRTQRLPIPGGFLYRYYEPSLFQCAPISQLGMNGYGQTQSYMASPPALAMVFVP